MIPGWRQLNRFRLTPFEAEPSVTAIVPVRNRCNLTLRFLHSFAKQTYAHLRTIIVDSNSSDGTVEAIRKDYPCVTILAASDRDFWAGATNLGVRCALACGSEWLLTINDDSVIEPNYVEDLLGIALRNGCRILGSQINYLDRPHLIWSLGTSTSWSGSDFLRLCHHDRLNSQLCPKLLANEVLAVDALAGNGVLIHQSVFREVGLYNSLILPHYHADSELVMRAVSRGIQAWVSPQVLLLNEFSSKQKELPLSTWKGLAWSFFSPKSHLYLPALLYIWLRYCPASKKAMTAISLLKRFLIMRLR